MKKILLLSFLVGACSSYLHWHHKNTTYTSYEPEEGITCVITHVPGGASIQTGCYTGDITKSDNRLDTVATMKYQKNFGKRGIL